MKTFFLCALVLLAGAVVSAQESFSEDEVLRTEEEEDQLMDEADFEVEQEKGEEEEHVEEEESDEERSLVYGSSWPMRRSYMRRSYGAPMRTYGAYAPMRTYGSYAPMRTYGSYAPLLRTSWSHGKNLGYGGLPLLSRRKMTSYGLPLAYGSRRMGFGYGRRTGFGYGMPMGYGKNFGFSYGRPMSFKRFAHYAY